MHLTLKWGFLYTLFLDDNRSLTDLVFGRAGEIRHLCSLGYYLPKRKPLSTYISDVCAYTSNFADQKINIL